MSLMRGIGCTLHETDSVSNRWVASVKDNRCVVCPLILQAHLRILGGINERTTADSRLPLRFQRMPFTLCDTPNVQSNVASCGSRFTYSPASSVESLLLSHTRPAPK
jgi:hypothetical protein